MPSLVTTCRNSAKSLAPVGESLAPFGKASAPVGQRHAPVAKSLAPVGKSSAPVVRSLAPVGDGLPPALPNDSDFGLAAQQFGRLPNNSRRGVNIRLF